MEISGSRRKLYPALGVLLALGSPVGLAVLRSLLAGDVSFRRVAAEFALDPVTYIYLTASTVTVFVVLGLEVGRTVDRLRDTSNMDGLTGLFNRRYFEDRFRVELARARRYRAPLSLLLVDVDGLKRQNDLFGHERGDAALRLVGLGLSENVRLHDLAARWGGDEFAVLLPETTADDALRLANRVMEWLHERGTDPALPITVSIGVADLALAEAEASGELLNAADAALYRAKTAGRDRAVVFEAARAGPHAAPSGEFAMPPMHARRAKP